METPSHNAFYVELFTQNPAWSAPEPNADEAARWTRIEALVRQIRSGSQYPNPAAVRILDVGSGRGWLTHLLSAYGMAEGVEPVAEVVEHARRLFPQLRFSTGDAQTVLGRSDFAPYDLVVSSEVLEHVPEPTKPAFAASLARLLKPNGHLIITTPRREVLHEWTHLNGDPSQPVEDWLMEDQVEPLFQAQGFRSVARQRVWFDTVRRVFAQGAPAASENALLALYQVWAFQLPEPSAFSATPPSPAPGPVLSEFHFACGRAADRALVLLPDHPVLLTARARAEFELGNVEAARSFLIRAAALHADHAPARRLLSKVLAKLGQAEEASAQARRAAALEELFENALHDGSFAFLDHLAKATLLEGQPAQVEARSAAIGAQNELSIYLHPPAQLHFDVPGSSPGRFAAAVGIQREAWDKPKAGGCEFALIVDSREVFRKAIDPTANPEDRRWHELSVSVPSSSNDHHEFVFVTRAVGSPPDFRWALWRRPMFLQNAHPPIEP